LKICTRPTASQNAAAMRRRVTVRSGHVIETRRSGRVFDLDTVSRVAHAVFGHKSQHVRITVAKLRQRTKLKPDVFDGEGTG
jgi:hypothetical protein